MIYLAIFGPLAGILIGYNVQRAISYRRDRLWLEELRRPITLDASAPTVAEIRARGWKI